MVIENKKERVKNSSQVSGLDNQWTGLPHVGDTTGWGEKDSGIMSCKWLGIRTKGQERQLSYR